MMGLAVDGRVAALLPRKRSATTPERLQRAERKHVRLKWIF